MNGAIRQALRIRPSPARWNATGVVQFRDSRRKLSGCGLEDKLVTAHRADACRRDAEELGALDSFDGVERLAGDDDAALGFAEEQGVETAASIGSAAWFNKSWPKTH